MSDPTANQPPAVETAPALPPEPPPAGEPTIYDQAYVDRLRSEAAEWRTKASPYEEAYQGYDENERETLLGLAKALREDPVAAATWLEEAAKSIKDGLEPAPAAAPAAPAAPAADAPLTRAELDAFLEDRDRTRATEKARLDEMEKVDKEVRDLGYDPGTIWGLRLMQAAVENGGDLAAADAVVKGEKQAIIDDYVAEMAKQGGAAGVTPAGGIPSGERAIRTLDDAEKAMRERLARTV